MGHFYEHANRLRWTHQHELVQIEPWGHDSLRVRATLAPDIRHDVPQGLLDAPAADAVKITIAPDAARLINGAITAELSAEGQLRFLRSATGEELLAETPPYVCGPTPARQLRPVEGEHTRLTINFKAYAGERFYGLGQHQHGKLDQKGCVIDLLQHNTEVNIPFLLSTRGYGFLWNNPAIGRVELAENHTRWIADASPQLDYWITAGETPAQILAHYNSVTGYAPPLPEWAAGFWQCKLRYRTQEELLEVAREYRRRGLPLSVIVADFFHWTRHGEWRFEPAEWPDPSAMTAELDAMDVKLMVSIWPTVSPRSASFEEMRERGFLLRTQQGINVHLEFFDKGGDQPLYLHYYDATHPDARQFLWDRIRESYYRQGVRVWWLDVNEPEMYPLDFTHLRMHAGDGAAVANLYPLHHVRGFYEGMRAAGETEIVHLCRSAWVGSQRYAAAVWSGDIYSTFEVLRAQIPAGLNIALSGIPWWTTDIGGFRGGQADTPYFRELLVRWFQYGAFCPLFRLHGFRSAADSPNSADHSGVANEVWSYGDEVYKILVFYLHLRERLRPYIMDQMNKASTDGTPPMRPVFFDFPEDARCYTVDDEYMFGPDLLVAPVVSEGTRQRSVYLPEGAQWTDAWTGQHITGGQTVTVDAPLERIPLFLRNGATLPIHAPNAT
ncbi:MAG: glycoside hydrolase family 31 protein [Chloroflexi bacterium]|nr:glycoside hydrolase family 31 protein [Chloroflexota bacterium]